jgi:hypothetical protein
MMKNFCFLLFFLPLDMYAQNASNVVPVEKQTKDTSRQRDLIDIGKKLFHFRQHINRVEKDKKLYFSALPISSSVPGGNGRALITSTSAGTYFGPRKTTNISSATFAPYWNFGSRFGLPLRTGIWLPNNTWTIQGDIRFLVYPQLTWGLGSTPEYSRNILVDANYIRFYQSVLKSITPYFFAGLGYDLDFHGSIKSDDPNITLKQFTDYNYGVNGNSFSSGLTFNLLYDTRNNSINPLPGSYVNIVFRNNPTFLGSNANWQSLYLDARRYLSLNKNNHLQQNTLAFWSYFWTVFNGNAPYLDLPAIGWDSYNRSGEGIDQSRYRGKSLFYFESEYRRDISHDGLLGFVVFANVNTVSGSGMLFTSWHSAAGAGMRIKFNKASKTNVCLDYGFSNGYNAIIINLGETF